LWATFLERVIDPVTWFTLALTVVAIFQYYLTKDGLEETRKAAQAAVDSAHAAKASADAVKIIHRQWIEISDWEAEAIEHTKVPMLEFRINMTLANKSALPVVIRTVRAAFGRGKGAHEWYNSDLGPGETMHASVSRIFTGEERERFETSRPSLVIEGWVHFFDAFGDPQDQPFGKYFQFGPTNGKPIHIRNVAGLNKSLAELAAEWPLNEPTEYTQPTPKAEHKPEERKA
jgi:hypothetical protein